LPYPNHQPSKPIYAIRTTTSDLIDFRLQLLKEFKQLLSEKQTSPERLLKSHQVNGILQISPGNLQNLPATKH